ncbi:hypothetical protein CIRG_08766 [Coccidioides immitis RMSCC 2394]|uniref:Uncharacterized protein n=1 Tax=Coccidioides immitis RMSCC 2394 TaxID=404692 RepID=A0A0J6YN15_COCIT|nr:hypothetical protein CIRG_08766 [Coccidioides immitis RMSCC 2394]
MAEERHPPEDLHSRRRTLRPTTLQVLFTRKHPFHRRLSIPHINTPRRQTLPSLVRIPHGCVRKQSTWALFYTIPYTIRIEMIFRPCIDKVSKSSNKEPVQISRLEGTWKAQFPNCFTFKVTRRP